MNLGSSTQLRQRDLCCGYGKVTVNYIRQKTENQVTIHTYYKYKTNSFTSF